MSRPEARRRAHSVVAHQIAEGLADFDDNSAEFMPPPWDLDEDTAVDGNLARAGRRLIDMVTWPQVVVGVALAVATGVVWGLVRRRR
jgi:hypothetical protein